jgi:Xaa-Pro dipeptidase
MFLDRLLVQSIRWIWAGVASAQDPEAPFSDSTKGLKLNVSDSNLSVVICSVMEKSGETMAAGLLDAQIKAKALFAEIQAQSLIRPGAKESEINESIYALAGSLYGISRYWHKRIVRAGRNTLAPYDENPPDLTVEEDDIVFLDLGPVFEDWEADFGRTYVVGNDPRKLKLCRDIEEAFASGKLYFQEHADITAAELYAYAQRLAEQAGWEYGGPIAGHLIGVFPHEKIAEDKTTLYVHPKNHNRMRRPDASCRQRHWILEIHFVDRAQGIGGFYEELLTIS